MFGEVRVKRISCSRFATGSSLAVRKLALELREVRLEALGLES